MKKIDIAFVILNYNIVKETIDCMESIDNNIDTDDYVIIIVDNGSKNNIFQELDNAVKMNEKHFLVRSDSNMGFARGNNVGIDMARKMGAEFICCLNNDTILRMKNFYCVIQRKYKQSKPALIGPRIILKNGLEQHRNGKLLSIPKYQLLLDGFDKSQSHRKIDMFKHNKLARFIYDKYVANLRKDRSKYYKETLDVILHGCCIVFTPVFFTKLNGFNPDTFLYMEEELLYASLIVNGLHSLYTPDLEIYHLEDVSTNTTIRTESEKNTFIREHTKESLKVLISYLESHQEIYDNENTKG